MSCCKLPFMRPTLSRPRRSVRDCFGAAALRGRLMRRKDASPRMRLGRTRPPKSARQLLPVTSRSSKRGSSPRSRRTRRGLHAKLAGESRSWRHAPSAEIAAMPGGRTHAWKGTVTIVSNMDMPAPAMKSLLNQGLLDGQHEVSIVLRPERAVRPVAASDFPAALNEIARVCQVWGGAGHPLLPITDRRYPSPYQRLLDHEQFDYVGGLQDIDVDLPHGVAEQHSRDF